LAYGCPVVSFDCETGLNDIIKNGVDGLLLLPDNLQALTKSMAKMIEDCELTEKFSERAVEAWEHFGINKVASMWEQLFSEAASERGKATGHKQGYLKRPEGLLYILWMLI
jgi:GalNAc-alpha-(1->4)-GalNAc-alpha-(1->3)-diNAcBac-PP-undecaprenol alpha-1,4-N-acetyl-D-galactosaminyltransferase